MTTLFQLVPYFIVLLVRLKVADSELRLLFQIDVWLHSLQKVNRPVVEMRGVNEISNHVNISSQSVDVLGARAGYCLPLYWICLHCVFQSPATFYVFLLLHPCWTKAVGQCHSSLIAHALSTVRHSYCCDPLLAVCGPLIQFEVAWAHFRWFLGWRLLIVCIIVCVFFSSCSLSPRVLALRKRLIAEFTIM